MAKVSVFLANGCEEIEALTVVDILRRAGIETSTVSITGEKMITSSHNVSFMADELIEDLDFSQLDMIVLPGGMPGTKNLEANELLMEKVDAFVAADKYVAAICAAPTILGHRGHLSGKKACCYPGMQDELLEAKVCFDEVSVAGKIITSRGLGTAIPFALKLVEMLLDTDSSLDLAKRIVFER